MGSSQVGKTAGKNATQRRCWLATGRGMHGGQTGQAGLGRWAGRPEGTAGSESSGQLSEGGSLGRTTSPLPVRL